MGRLRTESNSHLPPGLLARKRPSGTHYFLSDHNGGKRTEIPLGKVLESALAEYRALRPEVPVALPDREQLSRQLFQRAKKGARQRGLEFNLSVDDIGRLLDEAAGCCTVTGIPFDMSKPAGARKRLWAPSIDRIRSSAGYVPGNVRVIAVAVNIAMSDFGEEFLIRIAHAILRRQRGARAHLRKSAE